MKLKTIFNVSDLNKALNQKTYLVQFITFGMVGALNVLVGYTTYLAFIFFGMNYLLANVIGFSLGMINACYWNNKYVFTSAEKRSWWKVFVRTYSAYASTGIILGNILLYVWIELFHISPFWAPILNIMVTFPINYIVNKKWTFRS